MSAIDRHLLPSETVHWRGRQDWVAGSWIPPLLISIFGLFVAALLSASDQTLARIALSMCLLSFAWALIAFVSWRVQEFGITSQRVITVTGLLKRHVQDIPLAKVETVTVRLPLFGRIERYGTLQLVGSGGTKLVVPDVRDPELRRALVYKAKAALR